MPTIDPWDFLPAAKTKPTYTRRTSTGGYTTVLLALGALLLVGVEFRRWYAGAETQHFSVEPGVAHTLQINLDAVVAMQCPDLHVNVQDASGDRILAGDMLRREATSWAQWVDGKGVHRLGMGGAGAGAGQGGAGGGGNEGKRLEREEEDTHVGHVLGEVRRGRRKFKKTPKLPRGMMGDACRIFGSLEGNKVQGDFHITARGHGYMEMGEHLMHEGADEIFFFGLFFFRCLVMHFATSALEGCRRSCFFCHLPSFAFLNSSLSSSHTDLSFLPILSPLARRAETWRAKQN